AQLRRCISLPDNAQTIEGEQIIHMLDVFRSGSDESRQTAGGHDGSGFPHLFEQALQDAIHQTEIAIVEARLQTAYRRATDDADGFADVHAWQSCRLFKQCVGGNPNAGADYAALIFSFGRYAIEGGGRTEIHD